MAKTRNRVVIVGIFALALTLLITLYFLFNPANSLLAPKCPFKLLTDLDCPACGNQRSLHALLHGEIVEAFMLNPFLYIFSPFIIAVIYVTIIKNDHSTRLRHIVLHRYCIYTYIAVFIFWWIFRNTPQWHSIYASVMG